LKKETQGYLGGLRGGAQTGMRGRVRSNGFLSVADAVE
jgi:hypothetical protein